MRSCSHRDSVHRIAQLVLLIGCLGHGIACADDIQFEQPWKANGLATMKFEINGTGSRNNPLRSPLIKPFYGNEIFFRYRMRYDAKSIDTPPNGDGEFFVFWLDAEQGGETSTHSGRVPNVGLHVSNGQNRFMARFSSNEQKFAKPLVGDQDFLVVGRLTKSTAGSAKTTSSKKTESTFFDRLDIWVDPKASMVEKPDATVATKSAVSRISWVGFSTGGKTELDDKITVWDIKLSTDWHGILDLPSETVSEPMRVAKRTVNFAPHVLPILKQHCFECHAGPDAEQGIRLDVLDEVLNQTTPRNSQKSKLFQLVKAGKMPPQTGRLNSDELAVIRAWIDEGLDWDHALYPTPVPQTNHWAFQQIRRPKIPSVKNRNWIKTPVDAFIARQHEQRGIHPAPAANKETLDRRVCLDVLGLPVAAVDIEDPSAHIDKLLSHPSYGLRWGRHWLDVARWAESNGHQHNRDRVHAWRYRDWVVDAFNSNMPYDEFVKQQIAGDEFPNPSRSNLIATGFLAATKYSGNELDKEIQRNDILVDITNTTGSTFLGLTFECAQCHTHKFDPISIRDYYRLLSFFDRGQPGNVVLASESNRIQDLIAARWQLFDAARNRIYNTRLRQGIANPVVIPKSVIAAMKGETKARFASLEKQIKALDQTWGWYATTSSAAANLVAPHDMRFPLPYGRSSLIGRQTYLLVRGDVKSPGPVVTPAWPTVFGPTPENIALKPRTALANWLTTRANPLTARVWVNRIWQGHFGTGIVETSGDFGTQGTAPSHPELLDYLAMELIENKWNTNHIHRLILNSATYRQSHQYSPTNHQVDPDNKTHWRWTPRRLESEAIRDSVLAIAGTLDKKRGGPSVPDSSTRRGLYVKQKRDSLPDQLRLFDTADGILSCTQRRTSTSALQMLWFMNSEFIQQAAKQLAQRTKTPESAFELALNRKPSNQETEALRKLTNEHGLETACVVILNTNEFIYIR